MLTLNTATTKECPHDFGSWCCINVPTLVTKCSVIQKISSGQIFTDVSTLHCDLDLEHSNPIFSQDTPAYDAVLSHQVWLQTIQQFRRHNGRSVLHSETYRGSSPQNPVWRHCVQQEEKQPAVGTVAVATLPFSREVPGAPLLPSIHLSCPPLFPFSRLDLFRCVQYFPTGTKRFPPEVCCVLPVTTSVRGWCMGEKILLHIKLSWPSPPRAWLLLTNRDSVCQFSA